MATAGTDWHAPCIHANHHPTIAETGTEGMVMPSEIGANIGMGGACLAVAWKTRNIALKQTSMAAGASA